LPGAAATQPPKRGQPQTRQTQLIVDATSSGEIAGTHEDYSPPKDATPWHSYAVIKPDGDLTGLIES
jgi:hypothetical protein